MSNIKKSFKVFLEDANAAGMPVVSQSSVAGMGNVVSAQPGAIPGTTGTSGSGDISAPMFTYTKGTGITGDKKRKMSTTKKKDKFTAGNVKDLKDYMHEIDKSRGKILRFSDIENES